VLRSLNDIVGRVEGRGLGDLENGLDHLNRS
jgi:hypothetical protein